MREGRYIVIDIGTHKLEELRVLFAPGGRELATLLNWSLRRFVKSFLSFDFSSGPLVLNTMRAFFRGRDVASARAIKFVCVEPNIDVCRPSLKRFAKDFDVDYYPIAIFGHSHKDDCGVIGLNCYKNSLSSSIYNKNDTQGERRLACLGFKFSVFFDLLKSDLDISAEDEVILRVNCEGAELGIVRAIRDSGVRVRAIYGSLADVRKIHGESEYNEMLGILSDLGINYDYFVGSNPSTWLQAFRSPTLSTLIYKSPSPPVPNQA
jgi:hypothetical protein